MSNSGPASDAHADAARALLQKAGEDIMVIRKLLDDAEVSDDVIGFHAQQAVEKSIKAVLTWQGAVFRRTHDVLELVDICRDSGIEISWSDEKLAQLNPFAVEFRYGFMEEPETVLPRNDAQSIAAEVHAWADEIVRT